MRQIIIFFLKGIVFGGIIIFIVWSLFHYREFNIKGVNISSSFKSDSDHSLTFLFLGKPGGKTRAPDLTDTIIISHLNKNKIYLISLPRDLWIKIPQSNLSNKINYLYAYENHQRLRLKQPPSFELIKQKVTEITGLKIDYVLVIDLVGLAKFIDALGGINIWLEKDIFDPHLPHPHNPQENFYLKAGWRYLDGKTAAMFIRSRFAPEGDFYRIAHQQDLIRALGDKLTQLNKIWGLFNWLKLWQFLQGHLVTNIDLPTFFELLKLTKEINIEEIKSLIISNRGPHPFLLSATIPSGENNDKEIYILLPRLGFENYEEIKSYLQTEINQ